MLEELPADEAHALVLDEVAGVLLALRAAVGVEQPAHVRVPEPVQRAQEAVAVADVRGVRVALLVGVGVVLAVVGDPGDHRALDRHRPERGEQVLDRLVGLERPVREQAVVADGHAEAGDDVHDRQHGEVGPADVLVPEQHDRGDEREERDDRSDEVRDLVRTGHGLDVSRNSAITPVTSQRISRPVLCSLVTNGRADPSLRGDPRRGRGRPAPRAALAGRRDHRRDRARGARLRAGDGGRVRPGRAAWRSRRRSGASST